MRALLAHARLVTLTGSWRAWARPGWPWPWPAELRATVSRRRLAGGTGPAGRPRAGAGAVAQALGLREEPGRPLLELLDYLQHRQLLLVLDNCEHLLAACAALAAALLRACPRLRILATSREALGWPARPRYRVPSLAVPDPQHLPAPSTLAGLRGGAAVRAAGAEPARRLRADRGRMPGRWRRSARGWMACRWRSSWRRRGCGSLPVEAIAARLDDRFRLLTGGTRDRRAPPADPAGHAGLELGPAERAERVLLRRLAVFAGGWTLEAAEAVVRGRRHRDAGRCWTCWRAGGQVAGAAGGSETERRAGALPAAGDGAAVWRERLAASGGGRTAAGPAPGLVSALAEEAAPPLRAGAGRWLDRLEREHDNLRAALGWAPGAARLRRGCGWRARSGASGTCAAIFGKAELAGGGAQCRRACCNPATRQGIERCGQFSPPAERRRACSDPVQRGPGPWTSAGGHAEHRGSTCKPGDDSNRAWRLWGYAEISMRSPWLRFAR